MTRPSPVTVLYVIDALGEGGTERSLADLLPRLQALGVRPIVVTLRERTEEGVEPDVRRAGIAIRQLHHRGALRRAVALKRLVREVHPALVHTMLYDANLVGRLATAASPVPCVCSLVNTTYDPARGGDARRSPLKAAVARRIDGLTGRHLVARFHAVSEAVKRDAVKALRLDPSRVVVIARGRDTTRLGAPSPGRRTAVRHRLGLAGDAPMLLHIGRQEYQKAHDTLLFAMAGLRDSHPGVRLLAAGRQGPETGRLVELRDRLGLSDRVWFLGHRQDIGDLLAAADVLVLPSRFEGMPGAALEAMAMAVPVVASDIPSIREVVEPGITGDLVPVDDPGALAGTVGALLDDADRRRAYGAAAQVAVAERFTIERAASALRQFYDDVLAER